MERELRNEESNPRLKATLLEVVENQLRDNNPPDTRETLDRLIAEGLSEEVAKKHIARAVLIEVQDAIENQRPFNAGRYARNLKNLPKEPEG